MKIYLIGRTTLDLETFLNFLQDQKANWRPDQSATEQEKLVEIAARICYMSFGEKQCFKPSREFLEEIISMGHESVLEHVGWSFLITGVSRSFTHQLVRHRAGFSFSQLSQQYCDQSDINFIEPTQLAKIPYAQVIWHKAMENAKKAYREILENLQKIKLDDLTNKEIRRAIFSMARSVLPNATETKILLTANARALRHFLKARGSILGDGEMRLFSAKLLDILQQEAPSLFLDFYIEELSDNLPAVFFKKKEHCISSNLD